MAQSINLLPQLAEAEIQKGVYKRKINLVAIGSLLLVLAVTLGLYSWQLFLSTQARRAETQASEKEKEISQKAPLEIKQRTLVDKLEAAKAYLDKNKSTAVAFKEIIDLTNAGAVSLTKVDVNSAGEINITGNTSGSTQLGVLFDNLTNEGAQVSLSKVVATSVTLSSGGYQFSIRLNYTKNGILPERLKDESQKP